VLNEDFNYEGTTVFTVNNFCILVGGELPSDVLKLLNGKTVYPEVFMNVVSL